MPSKPGSDPKSEPPSVGVSHAMRWTETQTFHCGIDHAVIGLMDPAHGPYVHAHWWWRKTPAGERKTLRAPAQRLCDDAAQGRPNRSIACW